MKLRPCLWLLGILLMAMGAVSQNVTSRARQRTIRILGIAWLSTGNSIVQNSELYSSYLMAGLAMKHFNERYDGLISAISTVKNCSIQLTLDGGTFADSTASPRVGMELFITRFTKVTYDVVFTTRSDVSQPIGVTAGALSVPVISYASSANFLSDETIYPTFFRTIPADSFRMLQMLHLLSSWNYRAMAFIYGDDSFGTDLRNSLQTACTTYGLQLIAASYSATSTGDDLLNQVRQGMQVFIGERVRTVYYYGPDDTIMYTLAQVASEFDLFGNRLFISDRLPTPVTLANAPNPQTLLALLEGSLVVSRTVRRSNPQWQKFTTLWPTWNVTELNEYLPATTTADGTPFRVPDDYLVQLANQLPVYEIPPLAYDTFVALGLAACGTNGSLLDNLNSLSFDGTTGKVSFNDQQNQQNMLYSLSNIQVDNASSTFKIVSVAIGRGGNWTSVNMTLIRFGDGTNIIPPDIDAPAQQIDHLTIGAVVWGYLEVGFAAGSSISVMIYLMRHRTAQVFVDAQPVFLSMIAFGCLMMGTSIVGLVVESNGGCMAFVWLFALGFTLVLASLSAKSIRVAVLWYYRGPLQKRNRSVRANVLITGVSLTMLGLIIILIAWQAVAPIKFSLTTSKKDMYGFPLYSSAMCAVTDEVTITFLAIAITYMCLVLLATMWISFWVRNAPEKFQEARMTAAAGVSMFQVFFVGIPTAAAVWNTALPRFFVLSSLVFLLCIIILFTMFLPKIFRKQFGVSNSSDYDNPQATGGSRERGTPAEDDEPPRIKRSFVERVLEKVSEEPSEGPEVGLGSPSPKPSAVIDRMTPSYGPGSSSQLQVT